MRGLSKLIQSQFRLFLREPAAFFFTLVFPALLLVIFGSIYGSQGDPRRGTGFGFVDVYIPALGGIIIGSVGLIGIPIGNATRRESGTLRRYRATPMRPITYITADVVVNLVMSIAGMAILVLLGLSLYHVKFGGNALVFLAGFVLCALSLFACGYVVAGITSSARGAQVLGQLIYFPMMFLSGAAMPREFMPPTVLTISNFLPLTHCVTLLQNLWRADPLGAQLVPAAVVAGVLVAAAFLAARMFRWE